ncbi:MAG TPA: sulfatase-like hydrolase/transferase, partial [Opitutaceae bacterium]
PMPNYPSRPEYAGLLEELDQCTGRIVDAVDQHGLANNTLIVFVSDNGGLEHEQSGRITTSNAPLRGEKGTLYEGGVRVPCIARWAGTIPAGKESATVGSTIDFYSTFIDLARASAPGDQPLDGASLLPVLRDPAARLGRDSLYWHLPHYHHSTPASSVRQGDWKLIEFFEDGALELYNLADDLGETKNRAKDFPDRAKALQAALKAWRKEVQAQLPQRNPAYDPARVDERWNRSSVTPIGGGGGKEGGEGKKGRKKA